MQVGVVISYTYLTFRIAHLAKWISERNSAPSLMEDSVLMVYRQMLVGYPSIQEVSALSLNFFGYGLTSNLGKRVNFVLPIQLTFTLTC